MVSKRRSKKYKQALIDIGMILNPVRVARIPLEDVVEYKKNHVHSGMNLKCRLRCATHRRNELTRKAKAWQ